MYVSGSLPPMRCGVGDYTARLACALSGLPDTSVAVLTDVAAAIASDTPVETLSILPAWGARELPYAIAAIRRWNADIVHIQIPTLGYGGGLLPSLLPIAAVATGAKVVRTWHELRGRNELPRLLLEAIAPGPIVTVRPAFREKLSPWVRGAMLGHQFYFVQNGSSIPRSALDAVALQGVREAYLDGCRRLIVFFGFPYESKGVSDVFDIADPATDRIVIAGATDPDDDFIEKLQKRAATAPWAGKVTFAGFLSDHASSDLLAAADAVVLPFREGGGIWNSTIHAAVRQRSLVVTTASGGHGYDARRNVFAAAPQDIDGMRDALNHFAGRKRPCDIVLDGDDWLPIAEAHVAIYDALLTASPKHGTATSKLM